MSCLVTLEPQKWRHHHVISPKCVLEDRPDLSRAISTPPHRPQVLQQKVENTGKFVFVSTHHLFWEYLLLAQKKTKCEKWGENDVQERKNNLIFNTKLIRAAAELTQNGNKSESNKCPKIMDHFWNFEKTRLTACLHAYMPTYQHAYIYSLTYTVFQYCRSQKNKYKFY